MDPLVQISLDQWPILLEKLKKTWSLNIAGYYALHQNLKYPNIREAFQFKVYCPFGDMQHGFVATNVKSQQECIIFPVTKNTKQLEEALLKTNIIDWKTVTCIDLISSQTLEILEYHIPSLKASGCTIGKCKTYVFDKKNEPFALSDLTEAYLAPIKDQHIKRVNETWTYKHIGSYFYFSTLTESRLGRGLFSKTDNQLLAWVFLNEYNFLCHLYCEDEHRRKGYSEYLLKSVVNDVLAEGNDVYTYVENYNNVSSRLFDKLGFVNVDEGAYILRE